MAKVSVVKDAVDNYRVVLQISDDGNSGRLGLPPSAAMELAYDLIRASLDARFRNANAPSDTRDTSGDVAPDGVLPA